MPVTPVRLTTDHQASPIGISLPRPALSWWLPGGTAAARTDIELRVCDPATGRPLDPPLWTETTAPRPGEPASPWHVVGTDLSSDTDYLWRVRVTLTGEDTPGPWAEARFSTSLLEPAEVDTPWLEPEQDRAVREPLPDMSRIFDPALRSQAPLTERLRPVRYIRQELELRRRPVRARLFLSAQGVVDALLNGASAHDTLLEPGWTSYGTYTEFSVHDVTALIHAGRNTLGLRLADGWFAGHISIVGLGTQYGDTLRAWWQLRVTYDDGTTETLLPDSTARATQDGPIRYSDLFIGEMVDRTRELGPWSSPAYIEGADGARWRPCSTVAPADLLPPTSLEPFRGEPVRAVAELPVVEIITTPAGETVLDLGQVIAGRMRLRLTGERGTRVTLEHSEHLAKDGTFFSNIMGCDKDQTDVVILGGDPDGETVEPSFTFHGFRYCKVSWEGAEPTIDLEASRGVVIASDLEPAGGLTTSDERLNRLHENVVWSQRANFLAIPTDCPQRERAGWTGDIQIFAPAAAGNAEVHTFLARWLRNVRADQRPEGTIRIVTPMPPAMEHMENPDDSSIGRIVDAAGWGDAIIEVPWALYQAYGDASTLAENWDAMCSWVSLQARQAATELPIRLRTDPADPRSGWDALDDEVRERQRLLWSGGLHFGDWLLPSLTEGPETMMAAPLATSEIVGAAFHVRALERMAQIAAVLGRAEDAARCTQRHQAARAAFAAEYIGEDGRIEPDLQGMYVLVLAFGLARDAAQRTAVAEQLVRLVHAAGDHLDTGFLSVPYLLDVLVDAGHEDVAWSLLMQDTVPSWLYEVAEGATTIWEAWGAVAPDGTVGAMSFNHYAFGIVDDFLRRRIGGLASTAPGFATVRVAPLTDGSITSASTSRETPYGTASVSWSRADDGTVAYEIELPSGVSGELVGRDGVIHPLSSGRTTLTA